jgi:hypothetical protein
MCARLVGRRTTATRLTPGQRRATIVHLLVHGLVVDDQEGFFI